MKVPELPERDEGWHAMTVSWWRDIWSSPMAPEWHSSDVHGVYALALIYDDIWRAPSATARKEASGEFRLARKDFGLTPYDRRRLEWTIEQADEATSRGEQRRAGSSAKKTVKGRKAADPRRVLEAVPDTA